MPWGRIGLIGHTGFVGGTLLRDIDFSKIYNSQTIEQIAGERFDTLICAGAPATMWVANRDPQADLDNLRRLMAAVRQASIGKLILISTIAVLDNPSAGYTESNARYEIVHAYGRNRRELEEYVLESYSALVLRLPALFGVGLKKNFLFDILNPVPAFLTPQKLAILKVRSDRRIGNLIDQMFDWDRSLEMYKLDRPTLEASGQRLEFERVFAEVGFLATTFTNSESEYQFYNLANLKHDMEVALGHGLAILNVCSEPLRAGDVHVALTGSPFSNNVPTVVREDMRTEHASLFAKKGHYLYSGEEVMRDLRCFAFGDA